ncbi:MAG: hypothetical protein AAGU12_03175 [Clostridiales bacterium]
MKKLMKLISGSLILVMLIFLLAGCGGNSPSVSQNDNTTNPTENAQKTLTYLSFSANELMELIDSRLAKNDYPVLAKAPYKEQELSFGENESLLCREYILVDGIRMYFVFNAETNELHQFMYHVDGYKLERTDFALWNDLEWFLPYLIEYDNYKEMDIALKLSNKDDVFETVFLTEEREYRYVKNYAIETLYAFPLSAEKIDVESLGFNDIAAIEVEDPSIYTINGIVDALNECLAKEGLITFNNMYSEELSKIDETKEGFYFNVGKGIGCFIEGSLETRELSRIVYSVDVMDVDDDGIKHYANAVNNLILLYDREQYMTIADIVIPDLRLDIVRMAQGQVMDYYYQKKDGNIFFMVERRENSSQDEVEEKNTVSNNKAEETEQKTSTQKTSEPNQTPDTNKPQKPPVEASAKKPDVKEPNSISETSDSGYENASETALNTEDETEATTEPEQSNNPPSQPSGIKITEGGLFAHMDAAAGWGNSPKSEYKKSYGDTIYLYAKANAADQDILCRWTLPGGKIKESQQSSKTVLCFYISTSQYDPGFGNVTLSLKSTGEILETYYFSIVE